jgi:hypothetical protein
LMLVALRVAQSAVTFYPRRRKPRLPGRVRS